MLLIQVGCQIVAVFLHYLFTAVFSWMLCEGIMLYFLLIKVFNTGVGQQEWFYLILGWGKNLIAISSGIKEQPNYIELHFVRHSSSYCGYFCWNRS